MTGLWFKRACGLSRDNDMKAAMLTHGALALPVFEELIAICKEARGGGHVRTSYALIAHTLMLKDAQVRDIVGALDREGLVVVDRDESDAKTLVASFPTWAKWNPKDSTNAERQAKHRASRNGSRNGPVTAGAVTVTGAEVEEEKETREPPCKPPASGGRAREHSQWGDTASEYAAWLLPDGNEPQRTQMVCAGLKWLHGLEAPVTNERVLLWIRQHAPELITEDAA